MLTHVNSSRTLFDLCWFVLTCVGLLLTRVGLVDSCWLVSDSCWFVLNRVRLVLIRVDSCWYSCIRMDLIQITRTFELFYAFSGSIFWTFLNFFNTFSYLFHNYDVTSLENIHSITFWKYVKKLLKSQHVVLKACKHVTFYKAFIKLS